MAPSPNRGPWLTSRYNFLPLCWAFQLISSIWVLRASCFSGIWNLLMAIPSSSYPIATHLCSISLPSAYHPSLLSYLILSPFISNLCKAVCFLSLRPDKVSQLQDHTLHSGYSFWDSPHRVVQDPHEGQMAHLLHISHVAAQLFHGKIWIVINLFWLELM